MAQRSPHKVIVNILATEFIPRRGFQLVSRRAAGPGRPDRGEEAEPPSDDAIVADMEQFGYVRLDARRLVPRGARDVVTILVLAELGKYSSSGSLLRLLQGVLAERGMKDQLDELIVVSDAADRASGKKNFADMFEKLQTELQAGGADTAGAGAFFNAYPYHNFALVIPDSQSVPPHRLMAESELEAFLVQNKLKYTNLPVIKTNDPPIVWLGGREGQAVEIMRPSQTGAGMAPYVRRIERA